MTMKDFYKFYKSNRKELATFIRAIEILNDIIGTSKNAVEIERANNSKILIASELERYRSKLIRELGK